MKAERRPAAGVPEGAQTPEDWEAVIAGLNRDMAAAQDELSEVEAARRPLALPAATGSPEALAEVAELNRRQFEVARRIDLLKNAVGEAGERLTAALADRARAAEATRRAESVVVAEALVAQDERVDRAFAELNAALGARAGLARKLSGYGGVALRQLQNRTRLLAAAMYAGLDAQLEVGRVPRHLAAPLAAVDRTLLAGLLGDPGPEARRAASPPVQVGELVMRPVAPAPAAAHDPSVRW